MNKGNRATAWSLILLVVVACVFLLGCGRYGPPLPPESLAPNEVENLEVLPATNSITFRWRAPENDIRGKELKSLDAYRIFRKEIESSSDILDDDIEELAVGTVPDLHIEERDRLREEARAANQPTHRISVPSELKEFEYQDQDLVPGKTYIYRVVPVNQGGVEGERWRVVQVIFRGEASVVTFLDDLSPGPR